MALHVVHATTYDTTGGVVSCMACGFAIAQCPTELENAQTLFSQCIDVLILPLKDGDVDALNAGEVDWGNGGGRQRASACGHVCVSQD